MNFDYRMQRRCGRRSAFVNGRPAAVQSSERTSDTEELRARFAGWNAIDTRTLGRMVTAPGALSVQETLCRWRRPRSVLRGRSRGNPPIQSSFLDGLDAVVHDRPADDCSI